MVTNPYLQYQEATLETASQGKLLLMLYDGAIRFLVTAQAAMAERRWVDAHQANVRAQDIVHELSFSLNMEAGEIAQNLYRLYEYMTWRLVQANVRRDLAGVKEVEGLLRELRSGWVEAVKANPGHTGSVGAA
ncbi:MAG: flagellar export chaperone FliS [Candidatus Sericytochromatia bacterium]|nr:flagellar export chaperone FliS [Candidatus Sericytochromatia bacterium]